MPFEKGTSGNPRGRPKMSNPAAMAARQYAEEAVERLVQIMRGGNAAEAGKAAERLLDRAFGKPKESFEVTGEDGSPIQSVNAIVTGDELLAMIKQAEQDV